ncbi:hypothetical protein M408DRAFT_9426 [Serendipita vermifera MAFF 305830]|uniref:Uncharacterized protein n=1 Tax=Serendipita vermifera MAFF 305830 TaxID=933852 RepID=A0A0C3B501_SERVB|nr:hypothetical protein M408DRAFT_9426 [Serendipita vermifera MAFF 305830]
MLFEEYYINDGDDRVLNDIIEPLGLIPLYGYDVTLPMLRIYGAYQGAWITERVERAERWKKQAYAWSKLRYRPLTCHRWCCNPKVMVTEHDIQDDEDSNLVSLPGFFDIVENGYIPANTQPKMLFVTMSCRLFDPSPTYFATETVKVVLLRLLC